MNEYTLDGLISELQALKESGTPGETLVMTLGRTGWVLEKITNIKSVAIAKKDAKKNVCEIVNSRGIKVILLS